MRRTLAVVALLTACREAPTAPDPVRWRDIKEQIREQFPDVRTISVTRFAALDRDRILLVDVRAPAEFAVSRIPGAVNAPYDGDLGTALRDVSKDRAIVVYCSVGWRSATAARALTELGYTDVTNLEGSIFEWANLDRPLEGGDVVHPFDDDWGQLLRADKRAQ